MQHFPGKLHQRNPHWYAKGLIWFDFGLTFVQSCDTFAQFGGKVPVCCNQSKRQIVLTSSQPEVQKERTLRQILVLAGCPSAQTGKQFSGGKIGK